MYTVPIVRYNVKLLTANLLRLYVLVAEDRHSTGRVTVYGQDLDLFFFAGNPAVIAFKSHYHIVNLP